MEVVALLAVGGGDSTAAGGGDSTAADALASNLSALILLTVARQM